MSSSTHFLPSETIFSTSFSHERGMRIVTLLPVPASFRDDVAGPFFFVPSLSVCVCVRLLSVPRIIGPKLSISALIAPNRFCAASGVL